MAMIGRLMSVVARGVRLDPVLSDTAWCQRSGVSVVTRQPALRGRSKACATAPNSVWSALETAAFILAAQHEELVSQHDNRGTTPSKIW